MRRWHPHVVEVGFEGKASASLQLYRASPCNYQYAVGREE
jgi:hypothetical protein